MERGLLAITAMVLMDKNNRGFTFLELLIVIAIMVLFSTLSVGGYTALNENKKIDADTNQLLGALELAKKKARAGDKSSLVQGGVDYSTCDLDAYKITINSSTTYSLVASMCANTGGTCPIGVGCSDVSIVPYSVASSMSLAPSSGSVIFGTGGLAVSGLSTITVTNAKNNRLKTITISESGSVVAN